MKSRAILLVILLTCCGQTKNSVDNSTVNDKSIKTDQKNDSFEDLVSSKKYKDVFDILESKDPNENDIDTTIKKTHLCLDYFALSLEHKMFVLVNVPADKTIYDIRGGNVTSTILPFIPEESLLKLIEKNPSKWELHKTLGILYYERFLHYSMNQDQKTTDEQISLSKKYIMAAHSHNVSDWESNNILAIYELHHNNFDEAIELLEKSVNLDSKHGVNNHNLGYCYFKKKNYDLALKHAELAMKYYEENSYKLDSADFAHKMSIASKNRSKTLEISKKFISIDPTNPQSLKKIISNYYKSNYAGDLLQVFDYIEFQYPSNKLVIANSYVYKSIFYKDKKDKQEAIKYFEMSKDLFNEIYPEKNNDVFRFLDETEGLINAI